MIRFEKLSATEHVYPFVDAIVDADYKNGTFGTITDNVFTAGGGFMAIMQVEKGDDAKSNDYVIMEGEHARIADFSKEDGQIVNITADELPETYAVDDMLVADENGMLTVGDATDKAFKIIEITRYGARAIVVA